MKIEIDGSKINSELSFHASICEALNFPRHYSKNLDALFDVLSADIERPVTLTWKNSKASKKYMGMRFQKIVDTLLRVEAQDVTWRLLDRFEIRLE